MPISNVVEFVGRADDLQAVDELLRANSRVNIAAAVGMGGVGNGRGGIDGAGADNHWKTCGDKQRSCSTVSGGGGGLLLLLPLLWARRRY